MVVSEAVAPFLGALAQAGRPVGKLGFWRPQPGSAVKTPRILSWYHQRVQSCRVWLGQGRGAGSAHRLAFTPCGLRCCFTFASCLDLALRGPLLLVEQQQGEGYVVGTEDEGRPCLKLLGQPQAGARARL